MITTTGATSVNRAWGRGVEWLWRSAAVARARADARPLDADARAAAERARTLAGLAERHLAEHEPWSDGGSAAPVAVTLYRDAAREAAAALGAEADETGDLDAVRARAQSALAEIARREGDVDPLLAQRFTRMGGLLAALALAALSPRAAWYATHPDRGPDARWAASSAEVGYTAYGHGFAPPDFKIPVFFHTQEQPSPSITFDLERIVDVRAVTVLNRGDCCDDRAVPLVVEVSEDDVTWREVARRTETFKRWEARFAPAVARWVRLRATRTTRLHFESVAIR